MSQCCYLQLLLRGEPQAPWPGGRLRGRGLRSRCRKRCLLVPHSPATPQTAAAAGESRAANKTENEKTHKRSLWFTHPQRICLGLLNYLRSVERTLTFDLAGLQQEDGEQRCTAEETRWMNAARGGSGEAPGLGSLQFSYNNPVDCKVRG